MLTQNQVNDILGRNATPEEYSQLSNAPLSYLTNLKSTGYNTSYPTTILQPGMTGNAVKQLQDYLVNSGYMTRDQVNTGYGIYGPRTTAAVLALQKNLGVDYSSGPGYYGPRTLAALQARNQLQTQPQIQQTQPQQPQIQPQSQDVASVLNPYENPSVVAAAQNVADLGQQITAGREKLAQIPTDLQGDITKTGGIVTNQQLGAELKQAEAPITAKLKELGQQYNAARSTYSATLSAAKQAISQAKSQVSGAQSKALTLAGKIITLLQNGELDPKKPDVASYLSQIEQASGGLLPTGFFASITPKTTTAKSNIRSVQGGLYDVTKGKWIIPAKTTKTTTSTDKTALQTYLANQGLPITLATSAGNLSSSMLNKVVSAGVPLSVAQGLWENMKAGNSFEEIRQGIRSQGGDPSILDKFVQTLQGKTGTTGIFIPGVTQ